MLNVPFRCCSHARCVNNGFIAIGYSLYSALGRTRSYGKDSGECCKNVPQTQGRKVEKWPKSESIPPGWRVECSADPAPPNYDPYKIKVPEVVVPPLPPSNAKWPRMVLSNMPGSHDTKGTQQSQSECFQEGESEQSAKQEPESTGGFFGYLKNLFGRGKKSGKQEGEEFLTEDAGESFNAPTYKQIGCVCPETNDMFHNSYITNPDYWREKPSEKLPTCFQDKETPPRLGYHGRTKYKYAFHEPWKPIDRITLLAQAENEEIDLSEEATYQK